MSFAPLFSFEAARIDSPEGDLLARSLTFETDAARVVLAGAWEPLLALLTGKAAIGDGRGAVLGRAPDRVVFENRLALALREPPFPEDPTPLDHLTRSARLIGMSERDAAREADSALSSVGLAPLRKHKLRTLLELEKRLLSLAHATLGAPEVLLIDRPFDAIDDSSSDRLAEVIERVAEGKKLVLVAGSPACDGPEGNFVMGADHVVVARDGIVVAAGAPRDVLLPTRYVLAAARGGTALAGALRARGFKVAVSGENAAETGPTRLVVEVPDGAGTAGIASAALEADAPLLEIAPAGLSAREGTGRPRGP